ncbi:MAG: hypothetical protein ABEK10_00805 [Candidatus Nanosalina sp.]
MNQKDIIKHYRSNQKKIESRLEEFNELRNSSDIRKFEELSFVILTSQTDAKNAWQAVKKLREDSLILEGEKEEISDVLENSTISYSKDKADYIVKNRENLSQPTLADPERKVKINSRIDAENLESTREWFSENIKGISWKGASHFLRNIGYGNGFAIISSHIASQLFDLGLTDNPEPPKNRKQYLSKEEALQDLAENTGIDIKALDLVLWSMKTGEVFK